MSILAIISILMGQKYAHLQKHHVLIMGNNITNNHLAMNAQLYATCMLQKTISVAYNVQVILFTMMDIINFVQIHVKVYYIK